VVEWYYLKGGWYLILKYNKAVIIANDTTLDKERIQDILAVQIKGGLVFITYANKEECDTQIICYDSRDCIINIM